MVAFFIQKNVISCIHTTIACLADYIVAYVLSLLEASVISYKFYASTEGAKTEKYLLVFTVIDVIFFAILWGVVLVFYKL